MIRELLCNRAYIPHVVRLALEIECDFPLSQPLLRILARRDMQQYSRIRYRISVSEPFFEEGKDFIINKVVNVKKNPEASTMAPIVTPAVKGREPYILPRQTEKYRHKLDIGENLEPICPEVEKLLVAEKVHLYPAHGQIYDELRMAMQNYCGVSPLEDNILFTNGSDNALKAVIEGYFLPETKLLIPIPTYPHFTEFARNAKSSTHTIQFLPQSNADITTVQNALRTHSVNLCYLCSPNLPLGYHFTIHQLYQLLAEFTDTMFIVDEAYVQYTEQYQALRQAASATSLLTRFRNLIVTRTFSKAFGLAGLRIGCLLSHPENIHSLQVLVNHKSVTSLAMRAALETIQQLPYYNHQITQVQNIKEILRATLDRLCHKNTRIYGYNISGGNYFLLYAEDTKSVCQIFIEHGIYLRDKSAEIPHAIRSCIGTERQMREVLLLVAFINLQGLFRSPSATQKIKVVIDMDNTLRDGSKSSSLWNHLQEDIRTEKWTVCTNNATQTPEEFHHLVQRGIHRVVQEVVSPLTYFKNNLDRIGSCIFVIGPASVKVMFDHSEKDSSEIDAVLVTQIPSSEDIVTICKLHHEYGIPVFHTDSSAYTNLKSCAECVDNSERTIIPDLGSYMKMMDVNSTCVDKTSGAQNCQYGFKNVFAFPDATKQVIVIGDSMDSDYKLAQSLPHSIFIHINPSLTGAECNLDQMYLSLPNVGSL